jgi:hypothetical protein
MDRSIALTPNMCSELLSGKIVSTLLPRARRGLETFSPFTAAPQGRGPEAVERGQLAGGRREPALCGARASLTV